MTTNAALIAEKLDQVGPLVAASGADCWLVFVRETAAMMDPVLPFLMEGGLTWISALIFAPDGRRIAIVGNYDADPLRASGHWTEVIPYVAGIHVPLMTTLEAFCGPTPRVAVNVSKSDVMADGLTSGLWDILAEYFQGTRFEGCMVPAEQIVRGLRGRKSVAERLRIEAAIAETDRLFREAAEFAKPGVAEKEVYDFVHRQMAARRLGFSWDPAGDPIVNTGPDSMIGHGVPSATLRIAPGHVFHMDLGVTLAGYSSDVQRCWYVPGPDENKAPEDVRQGLDAVNAAISAAAAALRPGVAGWEVDAAARHAIVAAGYPEYLHAVGHQVGRIAHDGGGVLAPRWERYGETPNYPVEEGQIYTLELGVTPPGRGYIGIEEMVVVEADGCRFLTSRQLRMPLLGREQALQMSICAP